MNRKRGVLLSLAVLSSAIALTLPPAHAQVPGGLPDTPSRDPLPDPTFDFPNSPDPFLDLPSDLLEDNQPILEIEEGIVSIEERWISAPVAVSGAIEEVAVLSGFLPEPLFIINLSASFTNNLSGENQTAGASSAANTISANQPSTESEPQPPAGFDLGEPLVDPETPPDPETPSNDAIDPGPSSPEPDSSNDNETDNSVSLSANPSSNASDFSPNCQHQISSLSNLERDEPRTAYQELADCYQQRLDSAIASQDKTQEIFALNNLAIAQFVLGNYLEAKALHQRQLTLATELNSNIQIGIARAGLGAAFAALGDYSQAIALYEESLGSLAETNAEDEAARWRSLTLRNLGNAYYATEDFAQAKDYQQQSLQISQQIGDRYGEMQALGNIGNLLSIAGEIEEAISIYQAALTLAQKLKQFNEEIQLSLGLGTAYLYSQDYETAYRYYQQSLMRARSLGAKLGEGMALTNSGEALMRLERLGEAEAALREGLDAWESLRAGLGNSDAFKISLFETQKAAYRNLQEVLVKGEQTDSALAVSERGRTRAFIELLARDDHSQTAAFSEAIAPPTLAELKQTAIDKQLTLVEYAIIRDPFASIPHGAAPQRMARSESMQPQAASLYIWVIQPSGEVAFRQVDLRSLSMPLAQLVEESRQQLKESGRSRLSRSVLNRSDRSANNQTVDLDTLRPGDLVRRQGDPAAWAPYEVVSIDTTSGTVSVTHPDIALPNPNLPSDELIQVVSSVANSPSAAEPTLQQLHSLLIEPIADLLPPDSTDPVAFIPQEQLFLIPFAALTNAQGQALIEQHTPLTAPSIQALSLISPSATPRQQNPLIVGNPSPMPQSLAPLPHAQTEAQTIGQALSATPLVQSAATESSVKQQMPTAGLIHLATHGFFNESNPLQGSLALASDSSAEDGFLTVAEILEQPLTAQLVILSACDTGRGRITGDGVIGLSRSFLAAGAASVVVSLWQVPDEATASLMVEFHNQLQKESSEAQALRQAMLITRETYPDPHDWAAFTFTGNISDGL